MKCDFHPNRDGMRAAVNEFSQLLRDAEKGASPQKIECVIGELHVARVKISEAATETVIACCRFQLSTEVKDMFKLL